MTNVTPIRELGTDGGGVNLGALSNVEAEQALLGALMIDNRAYDRVVEELRPADFSTAVHARIYEAIGKLVDRNAQANPVTLRATFERDGVLAEIGGPAYLARLAASAITTWNAGEYARQIADLSRRRGIIMACQDATSDAMKVDLDRSAADILSDFDQKLLEIGAHGTSRAVTMSVAVRDAVASAERVYKADGKITGMTTGLVDLDRRLGGLQNSDLVILAGRPGMGKSALATCVAEAVAVAGKRTMFFSLEMSAEQLAARQIAGWCGVSAEKQRAGPLTDIEMNQVIAAGNEIAQLSIEIDDDTAVSVTAIRARARKQKRRHGLDLIVVDYLQLIGTDNPRKQDNRVNEVSAMSRGLKTLAKELNVPVVALSQLNRAVESRDDKRPMLADLRDSGSIEQDADVVIFIYRDEYYAVKEEPRERTGQAPEKHTAAVTSWQDRMDKCRGVAELIVAKNRHGATRTVKVRFDAERTRFENLAYQQ